MARGHLKCCPGHQSWGVSGPEWPPTFWESQSQENRSAAEVVNDVLTELTQDEEVDNNVKKEMLKSQSWVKTW